MNKLSIIDVNNSKWSEIVKKCNNYDFYHTQSYHLLDKDNTPKLFVLDFEKEVIALPLIIRAIPNSKFRDCTSAYGYCGPICSVDFEFIPIEVIDFLQKELLNYFNENNIVSVFSRLHPLITNNQFFINNFGEIKDVNKTIAIDLKLSLEEQKKQFRKSNKSELNQLRRKGFEVKIASSNEEIDAFVKIYHETMDRVSAGEAYYFDRDYFYEFLNNSCFQTKLLLAVFDNKIVAGAIFTITNKIMQYHLAGTTQAFIRQTPMKLILDEARLLGNDLGLEFLHLGGGVGGSDEDSLFRFKSGFSKLHFQYKIWQMIVSDKNYNKLVEENISSNESEFFPLYRAT